MCLCLLSSSTKRLILSCTHILLSEDETHNNVWINNRKHEKKSWVHTLCKDVKLSKINPCIAVQFVVDYFILFFWTLWIFLLVKLIGDAPPLVGVNKTEQKPENKVKTHIHTHRKERVTVKSNCIVHLQPLLPLLVKQLSGLGRRAAAGEGVGVSSRSSTICWGFLWGSEAGGCIIVSGQWGVWTGALKRQLYSHCEQVFYLQFFPQPLNLSLKPFWKGLLRWDCL